MALTVAVVPLWVQLSLFGECRERVERALAGLDGADGATARPRMQLSAALAWSLMYGVGRAREAGPAWATTLELAERLDDTGYRLRALWGLCIDQFNNGELRAALEFARRFADLAANSSDAIDLMMADRLLATTLHYFGDQRKARHHIDRALAHLAALAQQPQIVRVRFDMRVSTHYFQARILWLQGFAEQALRVVEHNIEEGQRRRTGPILLQRPGPGGMPDRLLGRRSRRCRALRRDAARPYRAPPGASVAGLGSLLQRPGDRQARRYRRWAAALRGGLEQAGEARFLPRFLLLLGELAVCLGKAGEIWLGARDGRRDARPLRSPRRTLVLGRIAANQGRTRHIGGCGRRRCRCRTDISCRRSIALADSRRSPGSYEPPPASRGYGEIKIELRRRASCWARFTAVSPKVSRRPICDEAKSLLQELA